MTVHIQTKLTKIKNILLEMENVIVAYSGGVDSTLMLKIAHDVLGDKVIGITGVSASITQAERLEAETIASEIGSKFLFITSEETNDPNYLENSPNRCFFCKSDLYDRLNDYAEEHGYNFVIDGTNADDTGDHRPGRQAALSLGVRSPLVEAGFTKEDIRHLSREYGLSNWDKPAAACLASRVPYGTMINIPMLNQIEQAEKVLRDLGLRQLRVRHHDQIARIEVESDFFTQVIEHRETIVNAFKELGYSYVTLDLKGFRSGSMNEVIKVDGHRQTA